MDDSYTPEMPDDLSEEMDALVIDLHDHLFADDLVAKLSRDELIEHYANLRDWLRAHAAVLGDYSLMLERSPGTREGVAVKLAALSESMVATLALAVPGEDDGE